jgi:Domain of unknown function (DUF4148)
MKSAYVARTLLILSTFAATAVQAELPHAWLSEQMSMSSTRTRAEVRAELQDVRKPSAATAVPANVLTAKRTVTEGGATLRLPAEVQPLTRDQ